jgi:hypothetical protein
MSLEGSQPVERTEELILGKDKEPLACGGCGVSRRRKVSLGPSSVNVCSIRGWSCRRWVLRSWRG